MQSGLSNGNITIVDTPDLPHKARGEIVLPDGFYVLPTFENGQRSTIRSLRRNKKTDLIHRIWQALPAGYRVSISNNLFGCQYYLSAVIFNFPQYILLN